MQQEIRYSVRGVSKLDMLKLKDERGVEFAEIPVPAGTYGEPVLFTMTVTLAALQVLGAYLLKKRTQAHTEIEIEEIHPDGRSLRKRIVLDNSSQEPTKALASVMEKIHGR